MGTKKNLVLSIYLSAPFAQNGTCQTDGGRFLKFLPRSDPDNFHCRDARRDRNTVVVRGTGFYALEFRAVRARSSNLSCDVTLEVGNSEGVAGDGDGDSDGDGGGGGKCDRYHRMFACPPETLPGFLVTWSTILCLQEGQTVDLKTPETSGAFR